MAARVAAHLAVGHPGFRSGGLGIWKTKYSVGLMGTILAREVHRKSQREYLAPMILHYLVQMGGSGGRPERSIAVIAPATAVGASTFPAQRLKARRCSIAIGSLATQPATRRVR
jgi:hypothetical protein